VHFALLFICSASCTDLNTLAMLSRDVPHSDALLITHALSCLFTFMT
jgi:hypothetical protein